MSATGIMAHVACREAGEKSIPLAASREAALKKTTLIGNFVAWVAIAFACTAFLAWYHLSDADVVADAITSSALAQLGVILASPLLLYAIGAVVGLLLVWLKKIEMGRGARVALRVVSVLVLAFFAVSALPALGIGDASAFVLPTAISVYVARTAPIFIVFLGFLYALGCAPINRTRRGPLADYLPDDHFE